MKKLHVALLLLTMLLASTSPDLPAEAKGNMNLHLEAYLQEPLAATEPASIEIANLSCQELSALGSAVSKVLDEEWKLDNIRRLALARAEELSGEAEDVGGLFSGLGGLFKRFLSSVGWIEVQPPENVITLSIESEATILAIGAVAEQWLTGIGPTGQAGAAIVAILTPLAEWGGKEWGTKATMENIGYFTVTKPGVGTMDVIYDKQSKEACVNIALEDLEDELKEEYGWESERIYMFIPFDQEPPKLRKTDGEFDYKVISKGEAIQPQLKAPWEGIARISQGNHGSYSHYDNDTWDNTYAIDVALQVGSDVLTPADGLVVMVDPDPSGLGGKELAVEHTGPSGEKFHTVYLHLSTITVKIGDVVKQGDVVAKSGQSGEVTAPHLHFHIWSGTGSYDSHTIPIQRLILKQVGVDSDFREYDSRNGDLDDNKVVGQYFESNNTKTSIPTPDLSHPWPMSGHDAQNTNCSPYEGPGIPSTKRVIGFDDLWINSRLLVSSDATIYLSGQKTDATTIIVVEPEGNWRKLAEIPGTGRLEAISPQGTLYVMVWQRDSGKILALNPDGTELWRSSLPLSKTEWTPGDSAVIGPSGAIYASCWDVEYPVSSLTVFEHGGDERWSITGVHSWPAIATDGTTYVVMEKGKVFAYDSQGEKKWEYNGQPDWGEYCNDVMYEISIGPDGTAYILPDMQGIQDIPYGRLIALAPTGVKKWHADIPLASHSQYDTLYGSTIDTDNSLYIVECNIEGDGTLFKVNSDGEVERFAGGNFTGLPIVDCNGTVYMGDTTYPLNLQTSELPESKIIAFNPDGSVQWISKLFNYDHIWPFAIGPDKIIYARGQRSLPDNGLVDDIVIIGSAVDTVYCSSTASPPTIDGVLSSGEWPEAAFIKELSYHNEITAQDEKHLMTFYCMHDEENLYIGVTITNDDFQMVTDVGEGELYVDTLGIYFDGNNNGVIEPNEGINYFWWLGYSDWFFIEENRWTIDDVKNGTGKATHSNPSGIGDYVYEFEIPLDSGDPQDIAITSQSTVGIMVSFNEMYKENGDSINTAGQGGWPLFAEVRDGQTYGKLVLVD